MNKNSSDNPILIVDDEMSVLKSIELTLRSRGFNNIVSMEDSRQVLPFVNETTPELLILDLTMPGISGTEILKTMSEDYPEIPVIVVTGLNDVRIAVECMQTGAEDYLLKPIERSKLISSVEKVVELRNLRRNYNLLKEHLMSDGLENPEAFEHIVTCNKRMKAIFQYMEAVAKTSEPVLIIGETGTGKELLSQALYNLTGGKGEFVKVNVAGLDDNMFTDTLFGHKKGAFTDAANPRAGLVEKAAGGVLFLDEIGDLSMASQVKLLRLLQEKEYYPLGSDIPKKSSARVVVATNRSLKQQVEDGTFRKDLYYRLNVHNINLPSLKERKDDIPLLVDYFMGITAESLNKNKPTPPPELWELLKLYNFPGNIRELRSIVINAVTQHKERVLSLRVFREAIGLGDSKYETIVIRNTESGSYFDNCETLPSIKVVEEELIKEALKRTSGNQSTAARILGITRQTMNNKLKKIEL